MEDGENEGKKDKNVWIRGVVDTKIAMKWFQQQCIHHICNVFGFIFTLQAEVLFTRPFKCDPYQTLVWTGNACLYSSQISQFNWINKSSLSKQLTN